MRRDRRAGLSRVPALAGGGVSFRGRVALVTGAAGGIGRATCLAFARAGARVVAVDRDGAGAADTARLVQAEGAEAISVEADVTRAAEVRAYLDRKSTRLNSSH